VRTTHGGPAPDETRRALGVSQEALAADQAAWQARREQLAGAARLLRDRVAAL
jgi:hypothetical protein